MTAATDSWDGRSSKSSSGPGVTEANADDAAVRPDDVADAGVRITLPQASQLPHSPRALLGNDGGPAGLTNRSSSS